MKTQLALTSVMLIPCLLFALVTQAETLGLKGLGDALASQTTPMGQPETVSGSGDSSAVASVQSALWQRSSLARIEPNSPSDELDRCCGTFQHSELGRVEIERSGSNDLAFTYGDRVIVFHLVDNPSAELDTGRDFVSADENPFRIRFRGGSSQTGVGNWNFSQLQLDVPVCEKMLTFQRKPTDPNATDVGEHEPLVATRPLQ